MLKTTNCMSRMGPKCFQGTNVIKAFVTYGRHNDGLIRSRV